MQQESSGEQLESRVDLIGPSRDCQWKGCHECISGNAQVGFHFWSLLPFVKGAPNGDHIIAGRPCLVASNDYITDKNFHYEMTSNKMGVERQTVWSILAVSPLILG